MIVSSTKTASYHSRTPHAQSTKTASYHSRPSHAQNLVPTTPDRLTHKTRFLTLPTASRTTCGLYQKSRNVREAVGDPRPPREDSPVSTIPVPYHALKAWYGTGIVLTSPQDHWMINQGSIDSWSENDEKKNFGPIGWL